MPAAESVVGSVFNIYPVGASTLARRAGVRGRERQGAPPSRFGPNGLELTAAGVLLAYNSQVDVSTLNNRRGITPYIGVADGFEDFRPG